MSQRDVPFKVDPADILPIIKRFMYGEREIFLRELISNAIDALEKLRRVALVDSEFIDDGEPLRVEVSLDSMRQAVTIADNGIGMTGDDVIKYINQIAVSGARDFLDKYADDVDNLIGRFGLGFYSSFLVSKTVEIETCSWKPGAGGCRWRCEGGHSTQIDDDVSRGARGTSVTCYLEDDQREFLDPQRIEKVIRRFLDYAPFPILLAGRQVNVVTAPWHMSAAEREGVPQEQYWAFYERLNADDNRPLGWFHVESDFPLEVRALLFLPDRTSQAPGNVRLFANRTFVSDHCRELLPEWLRFLDGVVDSSDIPLNVARDRFQEDPKIAGLRKLLTATALRFLAEILATRRADYLRFWERYGMYLKHGYLECAVHDQDRLCSKLEQLLGFPSSHKRLTTLQEYVNRQPDSSSKPTVLYLTDAHSQQAHLELQRNRNREVLHFTDRLDPVLVRAFVDRRTDLSFVRVDQVEADTQPSCPDPPSSSSHREIVWDFLTERFREIAGAQVEKVTVEPLQSRELPGILRVTETGALQDDMHRVLGLDGPTPTQWNLVVNSNCRLIKDLGRLGSRLRSTELSVALVDHVWDNIRWSSGLLEREQLSGAIGRSNEFLTLVASELGKQIGAQEPND